MKDNHKKMDDDAMGIDKSVPYLMKQCLYNIKNIRDKGINVYCIEGQKNKEIKHKH
jgi:hypothetical protein